MDVKRRLSRRILITGGTGTLGTALVELITQTTGASVIVYSRDEFKQDCMKRRFPCVEFVLGDVRDARRIEEIARRADVIIHTAALKHIGWCETNPNEAVKTNVIGTQNVIDAAIERRMDKTLFISTDKAAEPASIYGAGKSLCEKLVTSQSCGYAPMSCVRFGNLLGSRGSVTEVFRQMARETGEINITNPDATRFWITPRQAAVFCLRVLDEMKGGEVFVPELGASTIADLATAVAPKAKQNIVGVRPGDRMHEVLITREEMKRTHPMVPSGFIIERATFYDSLTFNYTSDNPTLRLSVEDLRGMIEGQ